MAEKSNVPTLIEVAKVAKINRHYLGVLVKHLCIGLDIKLPKRRDMRKF
ncbi:hypothetical protein LCGC14_2871450 [marine sediment metagenome]|uniref:Uncharacterized protein n=1 Tax=marine sediment metagenome TaxID=412755 RepID=A0A0F9AAX5_9ZZZZ